MDLHRISRSALDDWKAARALLTATIQSYQTTCATLRAFLTSPTNQAHEFNSIKEALATVDSELDSLAAEEKSLCNTRLSLINARNERGNWVQSNVLPPELLSKIFSESKPYCAREDKTSFQNFASVCKYWRQVAIHEPNLWTHVDVSPDISERLTNLLLERTKKSPIHVHIHVSKSWPTLSTPEQEVTWVIDTLSPHIHRVCTLGIAARVSSEVLITSVLSLWLARGNPSLANSLWIRRRHAPSTIYYPLETRNEPPTNQLHNVDLMLKSLKKVELQRIRLDWDSAMYRGLVNLQLSFKVDDDDLAPLISLQQLSDILTSSPSLVILKLGTLRIYHPEDCIRPEPVQLHYLQDLSIFYVSQSSLDLLLPIIALPESSTQLRIGLTPRNPMNISLERFISPSRATALYLYRWPESSEPDSIDLSFLKSLHHLQSLILDNYKITNKLIIRANMTDIPSSLCGISKVTLLDCTTSLEGLNTLVSELKIQDLRIEKCQPFSSNENIQAMQTLLVEMHSNIKCVVADADSREDWGYCSADI